MDSRDSGMTPAEEAYAGFLKDADRGFDEFALDHPELERELKRLHAQYQQLRPHAEQLGGGSLFRPDAERSEGDASGGPDVQPGTTIGDFRLIRQIGEGGMGQVWEAEQISLERRVALKFIRSELLGSRHLAYFEREGRAGGRLNHPGIVSVHGRGKTDGLAWIAMELVPGGRTLRDLLDEGPREEALSKDHYLLVARLIREIALAMNTAHEAGVIHRDLKPQNVLITADGGPKVTDFGLARILDESALSQTGDVAGTYFYMSPEQVAARRMAVDHRTDVFSLGVVLYELLTSQRPFQGDTSHQVAFQITMKDPPDPRSIRSRIPRDLAVICGKALEKAPGKRFATMQEMADDLERFLENEPIQARPPTRIERVVKWSRRHPTKSVAGAVVVGAFAVISVLAVRLGQTAAAEERRADEVFRLSGSQNFEDLLKDANRFWPTHPERIEAYENWIASAKELVSQIPALEAKRAALRRNALPRTDQEREEGRRDHPEFGRFESLSAKLRSMESTLAVRRGQEEVQRPEVDWDDYPGEAGGLDRAAWPMVKPDRELFGKEAVGLVLAERAEEIVESNQRASILDTLAWARLAVGLDSDALEASDLALEASSEENKEKHERNNAKLKAAVEAVQSDHGIAEAEAEVVRLREELVILDAQVDERRRWSFSNKNSQSRWWNNQLTELIANLQTLIDPGSGLLTADGMDADQGWSIPRRLAFAERLGQGFAAGGEYASRWEGALPAIRTAYPELDLSPQMGLVPLGADPDSSLWEFWHIQSGEEPIRAGDGKLTMEESSALVFVLLPGGKFWMGGQKRDPDNPNYDPHVREQEGPLHMVKLSPFFLSKFEMTQGQWKRLTGTNPSRHGPDGNYHPSWNAANEPGTLLLPVEQVSWEDCTVLMARLGLALPTEAQWEYGARGGTNTPWWCGKDKESLRGIANIADSFAEAHGGAKWGGIEPWFDDGHLVHAPVNTLRANPFGLHHIHGNVWELCRDGFDFYYYWWCPFKDPVCPPTDANLRTSHGGGFTSSATGVRISIRNDDTSRQTDYTLGLRPARALDPPP